MKQLLELHGISKSYSGVEVLSDIETDLREGEVLCLVGENGAGKSTLIKIISGVVAPDRGTIIIDGKPCSKMTPRQAINLGIATIYQDIDLVDNLTVADNVFLGCEKRTRLGTIDVKTQEQETDALLSRLGITHISASMLLDDLSTAQKQCVQIAKALRNQAKILILDEPTASLGDEEVRMLLSLIRDLTKKGDIGIIYISHYIEELFEIGDRMLILKDGKQVSIRNVKETTEDEVIRDMIGRDASAFYHREYFAPGKRTLSIQHYANKRTVHDVSLEIHSGEVFGLGGLVGAGRSELMRMVYGMDRKESGKLLVDGREITPTSPWDAIKKGIFMISEDRKGEGLLNLRSVRENIMVTHNEKHELIHLGEEARTVMQFVDAFDIKVPGIDAEVTSLSGGNQQKAVIARCVVDPGDIYIFDEPTKGVDVGAKEEIYGHILNLAKQDKFIIIISSDMPELLAMSDRIAVMREGRLVDVVRTDETGEEDLMRKYLGLEQSAGIGG